ENVRVRSKEVPQSLRAEVARLNAELQGRGRVLVRPSGTEPGVRVLAGARDGAQAASLCASIPGLLRRELRWRSRRGGGRTAGLCCFRKGARVCGIIGYVGSRPAKDLLLRGLERLEYRGYDSAGIALRENGGLDYVRAVGNLQNRKEAAGANHSSSNHGLGHTRWATHGAVNEQTAHPLTGCEDGGVAVVLNGIVENFRELRESLEAEGHTFHSETDAEVVAHLVDRRYSGDLVEAVRATYGELEGHFAFVIIDNDHPDLLVGARRQCPLVVGVGDGEMFLASAVAAFLCETRRVQLIDEGEVVAITPEGSRFFTEDGEVEHKEVEPIDWDDEVAEKGGDETFMVKEIYEQPDAVRETIGDRARRGRLVLEGIGLTELEIRNLRRIVIVACGTAYHAGVVGRYIIEEWARVPVEPDIASEWRYRNP